MCASACVCVICLYVCLCLCVSACVCVCVCVWSPALSRTSDLLGLNPEQLSEVLTHRSMILRGEEICTPLTVEQVGTAATTRFNVLRHASTCYDTLQRATTRFNVLRHAALFSLRLLWVPTVHATSSEISDVWYASYIIFTFS